MTKENKIKRQAVVVVHGMGEQRPMETLRSFVYGVKEELEKRDEAEKYSTIRSKPDSIGDIYETTRLSMDSTRDRPITDFYEFYWAHNMRNTQFSQMLTWMKRLIFTWVGKTPPRLKPLWFTIWGLIVIAIISAYLISNYYKASTLEKVLAPVLTAAIFPVLLSAIGSFFKSAFLNSVGDAARYFTPEPDNIGERSRIRQQGILFLKKLHTLASREKVDRIIIVAHSLGTVVAYDLLRLLWTEYNTIYQQLPVVSQDAMEKINGYSDGTLPLGEDDLATFQNLQFKCWQEQKDLGNPWLISDFITMGAAINAIDYLMVSNETIDNLIAQRELPVSPAIKDAKDNTIFFNSFPPYELDGHKRTVKILNHGALFAVTRWTNIFYNSDFVGGRMQRVFGKGIKDVPLKRNSIWCYPGGHTAYWDKKDKNNALKQIVDALQLKHA